MATVTAFIRTSVKNKKKSNVRFRLTDGRSVILHYVSNIQVDPNVWDAKNQKIKSKIFYIEKERLEFDTSIAEMKKTILEVYSNNSNKNNLNSDWFKDAIEEYLNPEPEVRIKRNKQKPLFISLRINQLHEIHLSKIM